MLPMNNEMPLSIYKAKKILNVLEMEEKKIHACLNDCILYRNELKDASSCPTYGMPRQKVNKSRVRNIKRIPTKVSWYFPPIPRFKRMFQSPKTMKNLKWHAQGRKNNGKPQTCDFNGCVNPYFSRASSLNDETFFLSENLIFIKLELPLIFNYF